MEERDREIAGIVTPIANHWEKERTRRGNSARARTSFLAMASRQNGARPRWVWPSLAFVTAAAVAVGIGIPTSDRPVDPSGTRAAMTVTRLPALGQWVTASAAHVDEWRFEEGTTVTLAEGTIAKLATNERQRSQVVLRKGSLRADVTPKVKHWDFSAGDFVVEVTGTAFDLSWDDHDRRLTVAMRHGSVRVRGTCLSNDIQLLAGQRETISCPLEATPLPETLAEEPRLRPQRSDHWQGLAEKGDFAGAVAEIARLGLESRVDRLPTYQVMIIADALRLAGHQKRAIRAYESAWRRGDARSASLAAFTLGRLATEYSHDPARAARWFERSQLKAPSGPVAEEAGWRHIESLKAAERDDLAQAAAHDFLKRHPDGQYSRLARQLIESAPDPERGKPFR